MPHFLLQHIFWFPQYFKYFYLSFPEILVYFCKGHRIHQLQRERCLCNYGQAHTRQTTATRTCALRRGVLLGQFVGANHAILSVHIYILQQGLSGGTASGIITSNISPASPHPPAAVISSMLQLPHSISLQKTN
jgi:hypothetical protein